jgi:hypothetical protein
MNRRDFLKGSLLTTGGLCLPWGGTACGDAADPGEVFDVVVYGATSAGVIAAVQAARLNRSVILLHPDEHLGGLTSGGLGQTDRGKDETIGGMSREFYRRIRSYYENESAWRQESRDDYQTRSERHLPKDADTQWGFEPHVARRVYEEMLAEAGVPVLLNERLVLDKQQGVRKEQGRITAIVTESGKAFAGRIFIDATYEGDLVAMAGIRYHVGREANATYGEWLNGVQKARSHNHVFIVDVDPYREPGNPASGLLPGIHNEDPGEDGICDHRVQAYCYRMCLTNAPDNRVDFHQPDDYNELRYELFFRNFEAGDTRMPWLPSSMPNKKTDTNNRWAVSTNNIGRNYGYPDGDYATRRALLADHESYQRGLMWTMAYHPRTPEWIRKEVSQWGLAKDEFADNNHWPPQIYVREARRMIGAAVVTEHDCRRLRIAQDVVGLGSYNMDSHSVQRYVTPAGLAQNEGNLEIPPGGPYAIPYGALTPKREECANLLACCNAVSTSHIAFGSVRMEPVFMILAQSAAHAAHLALETNSDVQEVNYADLRKALDQAKQRLNIDLEKYPPKPFEG